MTRIENNLVNIPSLFFLWKRLFSYWLENFTNPNVGHQGHYKCPDCSVFSNYFINNHWVVNEKCNRSFIKSITTKE